MKPRVLYAIESPYLSGCLRYFRFLQFEYSDCSKKSYVRTYWKTLRYEDVIDISNRCNRFVPFTCSLAPHKEWANDPHQGDNGEAYSNPGAYDPSEIEVVGHLAQEVLVVEKLLKKIVDVTNAWRKRRRRRDQPGAWSERGQVQAKAKAKVKSLPSWFRWRFGLIVGFLSQSVARKSVE